MTYPQIITTYNLSFTKLNTIISNEGKRIPEYQEITQLGSERTIERYIQQLRESNLIEFKGESPQTGGYYLTKLLKEKLK